MKHFSFPEIQQFRQVIRNVKNKAHLVGVDANGDPIYDGLRPLPTLHFLGTPKLHGTNSAICCAIETNEYSLQSREQIISVEKDNAGFARFCSGINLSDLFNLVDGLAPLPSGLLMHNDEEEDNEVKKHVIIYGEWCGGNIQENVAIAQLSKMFVVFAIKRFGEWLPKDVVRKVKLPEQRIFNIHDFPCFEMDIDFEHPEISQNKLGEITLGVEQECPVGKSFGVTGIGEGVVWTCTDPEYRSSKFWFKVKGAKHSASKTTQLASVDIEKVNSINELIDKVVTENRMQQGVSVLKTNLHLDELTRAQTGDLIRWVFNDVVKEESDTIAASGLEQKDLGAAVAKRVKTWFFKQGA